LQLLQQALLGSGTSVCETGDFGQSRCTYNIGKIGEKHDWIMFFGFVFVGGCILFSGSQD
jgi:hypothetical protein